ncbi:MAG: hypothetical protein VB064_14840 [Oscillospiraceae bacterium]|nr:hypothetical protein [Oscillospiraceae bacterium]
MAEKAANAASPASCRESVCIHTRKVFDACRDKDCIEDLRVYPTCGSQAIIDTSFSIRPGTAKLLYADVRVEELNFNRGCFTVDITYFYKVTGRAFPGDRLVTGLAIFDKRVVLFGGDGGSKVFTSQSDGHCDNVYSSLPIGVVEAVDPLILSMKILDASSIDTRETEKRDIPREISKSFDDELITTLTCKQLFVTLGQFSIIKLERDTQLLIPVFDYCIPDKECAAGGDEDPCTLFSHIPFPVDDFFPPPGNPNRCSTTSCTES